MVRSDSAKVIDNSLNQLISAKSNESPKVKPEQELTRPAYNLNFSHEGLINGLIMAEVLGKPKCLKRGRW